MLNKDLREFVGLLLSHEIKFLVVGAVALAFHMRPRYTGDLDIWVAAEADSAQKLERVVYEFGFQSTDLSTDDFLIADQVIQLGVEPYRIDILTGLSGLSFDHAWENRVTGQLADFSVHYLSKQDLILNKRATARDQDLVDVRLLEDDEA
ncbi:MAG: hypothetical protein AAF649_12270 [Verrucomicrobiota bacterium]